MASLLFGMSTIGRFHCKSIGGIAVLLWTANWTFHEITTVYSQKHGNSVLNATMSITRSRILCANLRFDGINTRERNGFNTTEPIQLELFLKILSITLRNSWFPIFIFTWMRQCIPQTFYAAFSQYKTKQTSKIRVAIPKHQ